MLKDAGEGRLSAAIEAAYPDRGLLLLAQVGKERVENSFEASGVLALAHEAPQLPAQHIPLLLSLRADDLRDTVVRDLRLGRIAVEELPIANRHRLFPLGVIGIAR